MARQNAVTKEEAGRYDPRLGHEHFKAEESLEARAHDGQFERRMAANEPAANNPYFTKSEDQNAARGIQNVSAYSEEVPDETVQGRFAGKQSVAARAYNKEGRNTRRGTASNDPRYAMSRAEQVRDRFRRTGRRVGTHRTVRRLSAISRWSMVGIVFNVYLFQLVFAIASLVGVGMWGVIDQIKNTWFGSIISFFVDLQKVFPADLFAMGAMGVTWMITIMTFLVLILWYIITGVRVFDTTPSILIAILLFALAIFPPTYIFPWAVIWVLYINTRSFISG